MHIYAEGAVFGYCGQCSIATRTNQTGFEPNMHLSYNDNELQDSPDMNDVLCLCVYVYIVCSVGALSCALDDFLCFVEHIYIGKVSVGTQLWPFLL